MCTVSWLSSGDEYQVFCNRDERHTRGIAAPPRLMEIDGVEFTAPTDSDAGGTWIAVNEFGITVVLLNGANLGAAAETIHPATLSRGAVVIGMISAESVDEVMLRFHQSDWVRYSPFTLAAFEPGRPVTLMEWSGDGKAIFPNGEMFMPLCSSSFDSEGVRKTRRAALHNLRERQGYVNSGLLRRFHRSHHDGVPSAYTTCMHRADARTVSHTHVIANRYAVSLKYWPGPPCLAA